MVLRIAAVVVALAVSGCGAGKTADSEKPGAAPPGDEPSGGAGAFIDAGETAAPTPTTAVPDCDYPGAVGAFYDQRIDIAGESRSYYLHVPPSYDPCVPTPMLLFFHGTDRELDPTGNQDHYVRYTRLPESADENGYILVIPSGLPADGTYFGRALVWAWSELGISERNEQFALALTDSVPRQYHVDSSRIFFAGFSSGAHFAVRLLARHAGRYAGAGIFAGSLSGEDLSTTTRIPTFLVVGVDDDSYVDRMRTLRDTLRGFGWVDGVDLYYEEIVGLPHEYPTTRFGGSRNQEMWDFFDP